jgi:hypothetical protein
LPPNAKRTKQKMHIKFKAGHKKKKNIDFEKYGVEDYTTI